MRRVTRNGVIAVAAASGAMALAAPVSSAFAADGASADGAAADSPGVLSGNTVQLPVHVPVNVCGNTVNVVGLLNPAAGNSCTNAGPGGEQAADGSAAGGSTAQSGAEDSPGVVSGNTVELPVHLPLNVSGNTANVVGVGNAATGNRATNTSGPHCTEPAPEPTTPARTHPRPVPARHAAPPRAEASLAHTGSDQALPAAAASAALIVGGVVLHRGVRRRAAR
ncbi:chaplin [Streptomyces sp. NPDC101225]|uniref:chaplin n=1 Tax=Streptomyces sp. NPDC101225 TaxID=3366135 RepID=UPI003813DF0C